MSDGRIKLLDGKVLLAGGKVATADDCCCGPCGSSCAEAAQPSAVVTIAGPQCQDVAGIYEWDYYYSWPTVCAWHWSQKDGAHALSVSARPSNRGFDRVLIEEVIGGAYHFLDDDPTELDCVNRSVDGTIIVDGFGHCAADAAKITFGGP